MKCEFASYVREKELSATIKMKSYLPHFQTQLVAAVLNESLSTLTSSQRSNNFCLGLEQDGTVAEFRNRVAEYLENRKKNHYKNSGKRVNAIKLERDVTIDITRAVGDNAIIASSNKECMLLQMDLKGQLQAKPPTP